MKKKQYKIKFSNEAETDFENSFEYYSKKSKKLETSFYKEIKISLEIIKNNPIINRKVFKNIRQYIMKKFPFIIYYQIKQFEIQIVAIFHTSRKPKYKND